MPDATREKLTKIYDAIDTTDSHDRGITIYEFRAATASLNMLYLFGSFEDDEEIWCGDESVRATLDRWLSGMWAYGNGMGEENFEAGLDALVEATGRPLPDWHRDGLPPLLPPGAFHAVFLAPDRERLYARIDARFGAMLDAGALDEVTALAARALDPLLPAMKAHGVPALMAHLKGEISREEAAEIGRADTRHYAKRQFTWFRHQLPEFDWVEPEAAKAWLESHIP